MTIPRLTRYRASIVLVTTLAAALRAWYVLQVSPPVVDISDPWSYFFLGKHLAGGLGYVRPGDYVFRGEALRTAEFPPLLPALLAALHLFGAREIELQRVLVALLAVATVPLVAELARVIAGRPAGILAALLAALSPTLIESDGSLMAETVYVPLLTASMLAVVNARLRPLRWLLAGAAIGLAGLARAEALLLVPLWMGYLLLMGSFVGRDLRRVWLVGPLLVGTAVVVLPWTVRNYLTLGAFVPVSLSMSSAILGANCPETYNGPQLGSWAFSCYRHVDSQGLTEVEVFARYREAGFAFMREHRNELAKVSAVRLARTWGLYRPGRWGGHGPPEGRLPAWSRIAMPIGLALLLVAAIGGGVLARRSPASLALLGVPVLLVCLTTILAYGNPRFRLAAEPSVLVLASVAMLWSARVRITLGEAMM